MTANWLKMNTDKKDFIWLGSKHQLARIKSQCITLEAVHVPVSSVVTNEPNRPILNDEPGNGESFDTVTSENSGFISYSSRRLD